jgi:hypothetical protein
MPAEGAAEAWSHRTGNHHGIRLQQAGQWRDRPDNLGTF